jgi:protein gp37
MSDFFHPGADKWREDAWKVIRDCVHLDWLILTKRPELIADRLPPDWGNGYGNVWLGVTVGARSSMGRIKLLKKIPAAVRFVSAEPLLEPLDFRPYLGHTIQWVITCCEQAKKGTRRLMDLAWVRDIDQQCQEAGIAHFFKQYYADDSGVPLEDGLLDGVVRQEWPESAMSA